MPERIRRFLEACSVLVAILLAFTLAEPQTRAAERNQTFPCFRDTPQVSQVESTTSIILSVRGRYANGH
jgi:hypothetical protein